MAMIAAGDVSRRPLTTPRTITPSGTTAQSSVAPTRPHECASPPGSAARDELTFVMVEMNGPGLDAQMAVETLSGDHGTRTDPAASRGDGPVQLIRLSDFLVDLSTSPRAWAGSRGWRFLRDEARVNATCDPLGHVTLTVTLQPQPWTPAWAATATVHHHLGDLHALGRQLGARFDQGRSR